jgi:hypothetical protein
MEVKVEGEEEGYSSSEMWHGGIRGKQMTNIRTQIAYHLFIYLFYFLSFSGFQSGAKKLGYFIIFILSKPGVISPHYSFIQ